MGISFEKRIQGIRLFEEAMLEQKGNSNPSDGQEAVRQAPVHTPSATFPFSCGLLRGHSHG